MKIGCVLLAAGAGERFGGNKLAAKLKNKPIIEYILYSLPVSRFSQTVIVAANEDLLNIANKYGISGVINDKPEEDVCRSIRMGIHQLSALDACMFCVADQPLLSKDTISRMIDAYTPHTILALSSNGKRGNPVIFPVYLLNELAALKKGESGKNVIQRHKDILKFFDIEDSIQLKDIDTKDQLHEIRRKLTSP